MYALIKNTLIENIILADAEFAALIAPEWDAVVALDTPEKLANAVIGGSCVDGVLALPVLPPPPAPPVPSRITMRQARLALLQSGLLASVDAAIAGLPEPDKSAAQIEWEYASEVQRNAGLVPAMAQALGMTDAQLDELFVLASTL